MKIVKTALVVFVLAGIVTWAGCGTVDQGEHQAHKELSFVQLERHDVLYAGACKHCGPQCNCQKRVSTQPGKCSCERPLKWSHVLKIEQTDAILCQCEEGCRCYGLDPGNPDNCSCGVKTKKISLVGSGIYFCNCGGSCFCNYVSDSPGNCRCGFKLIRI